MDKESEDYKIFTKLAEMGLVEPIKYCSSNKCSSFGKEMVLEIRKRSKDAKNEILTWRCSSCAQYKSAYVG
jgi:hypothetical protein